MCDLTTSLMAVYYASTQQRTLERLLEPKQVRNWIRGRVFGPNIACDPSEYNPKRPNLDKDRIWTAEESIIQCCFKPGITSVLTVSAPQALLSLSLISLLTALGAYLGFIWTKDLDPNSSAANSRNVFIVYITSLFVCFLVYSISSFARNEDRLPEYWRLVENMKI
jgi:hypothetical protein